MNQPIHLSQILLRHKTLVLRMVFAGVLASLLEGLTLSLIFPLLQTKAPAVIDKLPSLFRQLFAFLFSLSTPERIRIVALSIVAITLFKGWMIYLNNTLAYQLQNHVIKHYRLRCIEKLLQVGMGFLYQQKSGHLQTLVVTHTLTVGKLVGSIGIIVPKLFTVVVLLLMLLALSWKLTIMSLFLVTVASAVLRRLVKKASAAGRELAHADKDLTSAVLDIVTGMKVIRLFNREARMREKFESEATRVNHHYYNLVRIHGSVHPVYEITGVMSLAFILLAGSFVLIASGQGLESVLTFIIIFFRILSPGLAINQARVHVLGEWAYYEEMVKFLEPAPEVFIKNGTIPFDHLHRGMELRGIRFRYHEKDPWVLAQVSFLIPAGKKVGIIGPSGAGKSTIGELLLRFFDPAEGSILVDGKNLPELDIHSWRRRIGVVTQDTFLFNDTINNNIAFTRPEATKQEIRQAARRAHACDFIEAMPQGYDTLIGERGVRLSGGQRQRIAIARAILNEPEILLLDEATSALDSDSEEIVQKALLEIGQGKTVITIAHRLSTVADSDFLVVLDKGMVVETGTPAELLNKPSGWYRRLVQMQAMEIPEAEQKVSP